MASVNFDISTKLIIAEGYLAQSRRDGNDPHMLLKEINSFTQNFFAELPAKQSVKMEQDVARVTNYLLEACSILQAFKTSVLNSDPQKEESKTEESKEELVLKEYRIGTDVNMVCEAPISLPCPGYRFGRMPMVGYYNQGNQYEIGYSIKAVRLHPSQLDNCPESVQKAVGNLEGRSIDFFLIINNCSLIKEMKPDHYNLIAHPWAIPRLRENDDITTFVEQGIFETTGIHKVNAVLADDNPESAGLEIGKLGVCRIHAHPKEFLMAISPDNARFGIPGDAPFSSFFSVTLIEDRALVSFQVLINDPEDSFCLLLQNMGKGMQENLPKLKRESRRLDEARIQHRKLLASNLSLKDFDALPEGEKDAIYGEIWAVKGKPMGVDVQFGRKSFHRLESLDAKYHATDEQRTAAINNYAQRVKDRNQKLIQSLEPLFAKPKTNSPISNKKAKWIDRLAPIAAAFKQDQKDLGMFLFNELTQDEKNKIYGMTWEYHASPMIDKFGELSFHADKSLREGDRCESLDRTYILNLAAHREK